MVCIGTMLCHLEEIKNRGLFLEKDRGVIKINLFSASQRSLCRRENPVRC